MSDVNAHISVQIDTAGALAQLKNLQRQIATFHSQISRSSASAAASQRNLQTNLLNSINATGQFRAQMGVVRTATESFTHALETNKLSMREYFRYSGASTKSFGRLFKQEFDTIGKVAEERVKKMQTQYIKMGRDSSGAMKAMAITPNTLNMKDYATQTALAAQKQAMFNQLVRQGSTSLLNFGKNTQWAGRQLMVGFSVPLAYFGTAASKTFMDLEAQAIKFKRVYGDMFTTTDQTNKALEDIQILAKEFTKYGVAAVKTMELASSAAAMGKQGAELTAQVAEASRLAVLGGVEQAQALETTISLTNAFGIAAEDLTSKINFLNSVENQTVTSIEDLTIAVPKAGPVIKQLGGSVEDLAFFLTAMREGGINASEGANALKSGLASLINPSSKASKMLASLGINIKGIVEANKGDIKTTVIEFAKALDTLAPLERARAIEQLFGKFQFARLSTLFQNVTKDGTQASKVLELAGASIESLAILSERELKTVEDAVGVQFKAAVEELKLAIAPIGKTFLQAITPIAKTIANVLDKFNNLGDGTKKFIVIASTLVGIIGPALLMTFGLVANGVANLVKMFLAMRVGFLKLGGNTKILAEQTNYMNTEQLEAATVAASLNQAHSRLTQQFVLEASAVRALRTAYIEATTAGAKFALANPGMMAGGLKKSPKTTPKKYASGITTVPGSGTGDTVSALLTPGEGVVPVDVMKNPDAQILLQGMIDGSIFKYGTGTNNAGESINTISKQDAFAHVGTAEKQSVESYINDTPGLTEYDKARIRSADAIARASGQDGHVTDYKSLGFVFDRKLNGKLANGGITYDEFQKEWNLKGSEKWDVTSDRKIQKGLYGPDNKIIDDAMFAKVTEISKGKKVTDAIIKQAFRELPDNIKQTSTYQNMTRAFTTKSQYGIGKGLSHSPKIMQNKFQKAIDAKLIADRKIVTIDGDLTEYNGKKVPLDGEGNQRKLSSVIGNHPDFPLPENSHVIITRKNGTKAASIYAYNEGLGRAVFLSKGASTKRDRIGLNPEFKLIEDKSETLKQKKQRLSSRSLEEMKKVDADFKATNTGKIKPTNFGTLVEPTTGRSFPVSGIGGVYEKDGVKKFVKPMLNFKTAQAELRAMEIARKAHGLETPKQTLEAMVDPNNKTRKMWVLSSDYDPKFADSKLTGKFTEEQYFKQLVASTLRGDKDLKRGNLSGNILTDPGASGVFDRASGNKDYSTKMLSMFDQAAVNLLGVKGGSGGLSKDFAMATLDIPKGMSADQYHNRMIAEINSVIPQLRETLRSMPMTDPSEARAYREMYRRLIKGKYTNWRKIHEMHSSVLVQQGEVAQDDKTGKISPLKKKRKSRALEPAKKGKGSSNDVYSTTVPKGASVRKQTLKVRNHADAPLTQADQIRLRASTDNVSRSTARRRLVAEGILIKGINKQSAELEKNNKATMTARQALNKYAPAANAGVGALTGLTLAASFAGGGLGELAQKIMPFMFGIQGVTMLLPLLANPWVAAIAAIAAVGGVMWKMHADVEKARKAGVNLAKAMNMTSDKLLGLSKLTGTTSATEEANKKRENILAGSSEAKRTVGQNLIGGDFGKQLMADIKAQAESGQGLQQIGNNIANSLAYAVIQGVITTDQAASISAALGEELKSYEIPAVITGKLVSLFGPNGENLATDPLQVAIAIQEDSMKTQSDFFKTAIESSISPATFTNVSAVVAGGVATVDGLARIIGGVAATIGTGGLAALPGLAIAGTGVAEAAIGIKAIQLGLSDANKRQEVNVNLAAASLQLGLEQVGMNNGLVDSLNKQYDIKVKTAKTDAEVAVIEGERKKALDTLNAKNAEALNLLIAQKDAFGPDLFTKGINAAIDALYKEGPMKVFADEAKKSLEGIKNEDFKSVIQVEFASGSIDPITVMKLAKNEALQSQFKIMLDSKGTAEANMVVQLLAKSGIEDAQLPIMMDLINKDPDNFEQNIEALKTIANMKQKYGITLNLKTNAKSQLDKISAMVQILKNEGTTLSYDIIAQYAKDPLNPQQSIFKSILDNWTTLVGSAKSITKQMTLDFVAAGDTNVVDAYLKENNISTFGLPREYIDRTYGPKAAAALVAKQAAADKAAGIVKDGGTTGDKGLSALSKKVIAGLNKELKLLEAKKKALQDVNDEISRQQDFQMRQQQLDADMVQAKISGNYIKAALLGQQKLYNKSEYDRETAEIKLEAQIQKIQDRVDALEAGGKVTALDKKLAKIENKPGPKKIIDLSKIKKPPGPDTVYNPNYGGGKYQGSTFVPSKPIPAPPTAPKGSLLQYFFNTKTGKWELTNALLGMQPGYISTEQWSKGKKTYSRGGYVTGPGTTTSDSIPSLLSNKEYVWSAEAVKNAGGPGAVESMHQYFKNEPNNNQANSSSSNMVNNIYINGSDKNPKEIAQAVMVELDRVQKKNNKSNMVVK